MVAQDAVLGWGEVTQEIHETPFQKQKKKTVQNKDVMRVGLDIIWNRGEVSMIYLSTSVVGGGVRVSHIEITLMV